MMKPSPRTDFPVSVRRQEWEEAAPLAAFYAGIFDVTLNNTVSIMFVPETDRSAYPPVLPEDTSTLTSSQEARTATLALARYAVTADATRKGEEQEFPRAWAESGPSLVFYLGPQEFQEICDELSDLAAERPAVHNGWLMSEISHTQLSQFILSRFLRAKQVRAQDLAILGR